MSKYFPLFWKGFDNWVVLQSRETLADLEMEVMGDLEEARVTIDQLVEIVNTTTVLRCDPDSQTQRLAVFRKFAKAKFTLQETVVSGSPLTRKTVVFVALSDIPNPAPGGGGGGGGADTSGVASLGATLQKLIEEQKADRLEAKALREQDL